MEKKFYKGRNDRKYNRNKYNPKDLFTEGHRVLPSGAILVLKDN